MPGLRQLRPRSSFGGAQCRLSVYPSIPAIANTDQSALAFAHHSGVNAVWLDALGQVISRLTQFGETTVPVELNEALQELARAAVHRAGKP
jgi:hypothetical protein